MIGSMFRLWLNRLFQTSSARRASRRGQGGRVQFRPQLEQLEYRVVPAVLTFNVNTLSDTHAANTTTGDDGTGHISLRSAIEAAEATATATDTVSINLTVSGTITLSLGELAFGSATDNNVTITGAVTGSGAPNSTIKQTTRDRIFDIDPSAAGGVTAVIRNVTIEGGHLSDATSPNGPFGGGAILDGSTGDALTLTNDVITGNSTDDTATAADNGGAISWGGGGNLTISNTTISNNTAFSSDGGGIFFNNGSNPGNLSITDSIISGNKASQGVGAGVNDAGFGGGLYITLNPGSTAAISNTTFDSNVAETFNAGSPVAEGGAIYFDGGDTTASATISDSTFTNNTAQLPGGGGAGEGGAIFVDGGTLDLSFSRLKGNVAATASALDFSGANPGSVMANDNWWGSNANPSSQVGAHVTIANWLNLMLTAGASQIQTNSSTGLTATIVSATTNSVGTTPVTGTALEGLNLSFAPGSVAGTSVNPTSAAISNGTASATFFSGGTAGTAHPSVTLDNQTIGTTVTIVSPAPTVSTPTVSPTSTNEGASTNFSVNGTFTDPGDAGEAPFTAVVNWGDGSTNTATVSGSGNPFSYSFSGNHTYAAPGNFNVTVSVTDMDGFTGTSAATVVNVADVAPTVSTPTVAPTSTNEGSATSFSVNGTFTDPGNTFDEPYTAVVNWGDNTTSTAVVSGSGNPFSYSFSGSHTYAQPGSFDVTVSVTDMDGFTGTSAATVVNVADVAPTVSTPTVAPTSTNEGSATSFSVNGTFTDPGNTFDEPYTALVNWGDNTTSTAVVSGSGNPFSYSFSGSHTYAQPGSFDVTVSVTDTDGATGTSAATVVNVADVAPTVSTPTVAPTSTNEGSATSFSVNGTFTDPGNTFDEPYTALVNWGDNTTSTAVVSGSGNPFSYSFSGSHTYAQPGSFDVTVSVTDTDGATGTSTATVVTVANVAPTVSTPTVAPTSTNEGSATSFSVSGTFTDPGNTFDEPYTAVVNWGDNTTSTAVVSGSGNPFSYSFSGSHTYAQPGSFDVTVSVTDTDGATGTSAATVVNVAPVADVSVVKTGPATVTAGNDITYTITLSNAGPADAQSVVLSDTVPTGTTFSSLSTGPGDPDNFDLAFVNSQATATATAPIAAGNQDVFTFVVFALASDANNSTISNTASETSTTADLVPGNNSSTVNSIVAAIADLKVTKGGPATITAGTDATYTITLTNNGPSDAQNVSLTDAVPAGTTFVSANPVAASNPDGFSYSEVGGTITGTPTGGVVAASNQDVFTVVVHALSSDPNNSTVTNTANVATTTTDNGPAGNFTSTVNSTVAAVADVHITKTGPATVTAGTSATYTITTTNNGPSDAQNVSSSDVLPANTTLVSFVQNAGAPNGGVLAATASQTFTLVLHVSASAANGSTITNTANISTTTTDNGPAGNFTSTVNSTVAASADLSVTETGPASVILGNNLTYTFKVTNAGPADAQAVRLSDLLPPTETFVSQSQTSGPAFALAHAGNQVTDTVATLAAGASATFTVTATANASDAIGSTLTNTGNVSSTTLDTNLGNNSSTAKTTVQTNLTVSLTAPPVAFPGFPLVYAIVVTNVGNTTAAGVQARDVLPAQTTFLAAALVNGNSLNLNAGKVSGAVFTSNAVNLAAGHSFTLFVAVTVPSRTKFGTLLTDLASVRDAAQPGVDLQSQGGTTTVVSGPFSRRWLPHGSPFTF